MPHGAGICTNIYPNNFRNVGKYTSTMDHIYIIYIYIYMVCLFIEHSFSPLFPCPGELLV